MALHLVNKIAYFADLQYVVVQSGLLHGFRRGSNRKRIKIHIVDNIQLVASIN